MLANKKHFVQKTIKFAGAFLKNVIKSITLSNKNDQKNKCLYLGHRIQEVGEEMEDRWSGLF